MTSHDDSMTAMPAFRRSGPRGHTPQCYAGADGFPQHSSRHYVSYAHPLEVTCVAAGLKYTAITRLAGAKNAAALGLGTVPYGAMGRTCVVYRLGDPTSVAYAHALGRIDSLSMPDGVDHIIQGILLGYRKADIRAWHATVPLLLLTGHDNYATHHEAIVAHPGAREVLAAHRDAFDVAFALARAWIRGIAP